MKQILAIGLILICLSGQVYAAGDTAWGAWTTTSGNYSISASEERSTVTAGYQYTAGSADTIKWIHFYGKSYTANYAFCCAVYTVSASDSIASEYVDSVHCTSTGSTDHWDSTSCSIPLSNGVKYTVAIGNGVNSPRVLKVAGNASRQTTGALGDSWSSMGYIEEWYCIKMDVDTTDGGTPPAGAGKVIMIE